MSQETQSESEGATSVWENRKVRYGAVFIGALILGVLIGTALGGSALAGCLDWRYCW